RVKVSGTSIPVGAEMQMNLQAAKGFVLASLAALLTALPNSAFAGEKRPTAPAPAQKKAPAFTPEERAKRRQQIKERLAKQVSELEKKKASGTINDEERQRLERFQILANRFRKQSPSPAAKGAANTPPAGKPASK